MSGFDAGIELGAGARLEAGLDEAMARLERTLRLAKAGAGAVSFDAGVPAPERELLGEMQAMGEGAVSFASEVAEGGGEPGRAEAGAKVSRFLDRVLDRVGAVARVETRVEGRLVASTMVGLTGDFTSALGEVGGRADLDAHARSLAEELRARRVWTRIVLSTVQMAGKLVLATGTGNPLLALAAAWRFIRSVMTELGQLEPAA